MSVIDLAMAIVNGTVTEKDIPPFSTTSQLTEWKVYNRGLLRTLLDGSNMYWVRSEHLNKVADERQHMMLSAAEARKDTVPPRNLDLVVHPKTGTRDYGMVGMSTADVARHLDCFDEAGQMTSYEMDAYETMGEEALNEQGVETLHDLFGTEFANAFYQRKNKLLAKEKLSKLYTERARLDRDIDRLERQCETGVVE